MIELSVFYQRTLHFFVNLWPVTTNSSLISVPVPDKNSTTHYNIFSLSVQFYNHHMHDHQTHYHLRSLSPIDLIYQPYIYLAQGGRIPSCTPSFYIYIYLPTFFPLSLSRSPSFSLSFVAKISSVCRTTAAIHFKWPRATQHLPACLPARDCFFSANRCFCSIFIAYTYVRTSVCMYVYIRMWRERERERERVTDAQRRQRRGCVDVFLGPRERERRGRSLLARERATGSKRVALASAGIRSEMYGVRSMERV